MQKHELTLHGLYVWAQFLSGGLDVNREILSDVKLKLNWVADLKKFLLVDQAGDSELIFSHDWNGKTIVIYDSVCLGLQFNISKSASALQQSPSSTFKEILNHVHNITEFSQCLTSENT